MRLPEICIRRPVFATVLSLVIVLLGLISYQRLPVREYPAIDEPVVTVTTLYPGAGAAIVESQVTRPIEESLAGIEGIDLLTSISRAERSQITVRFKLTRDPDAAAADVRDRVARVRGQLPDEIDEPVIAKIEADAQPIMYLAFSSDRHSPLDVSDYADRYVKDQLQTLTGVADVNIFGERRYAMRIWLDRNKLAAYRTTPQDVEDALRAQNVEIPAGRIESSQREFTVLSETDLRTPEQFDRLILKEADGYLVRLADVARTEIAAEDERRIARFNGRSAVGLGIVKQATANPLEVSRAVREALPRIEAGLPEGLEVEVAYDSSVFIEASISAVFITIAEAVLLVVAVIFLFLRSIRATLVPLVTIPVSLIGASALIYAFGFSLNTLTLLAMVLAIGLVVDDAIVMLENIYRHVEAGMRPIAAAIKGSREIAFAVVAMTITLAAVYAPIAFLTGRTGRLFVEFALALAGAVLVSGFVALTLSPMMASRLLRHHERHGRLYQSSERILNGLTAGYRRALGAALDMRWLVLLIAAGVAGSSWWLFGQIKSELAPSEDRGTIIGIIRAPEGATIAYTDSYARRIEPLYKAVPEITKYYMVTGWPTVSNGISYARLKPWGERERSQQEIVAELQPKMFAAAPGVLAFPSNPASLGQSPRSKPVEFVILTSAPYSVLQEMADAMMSEARNNPNLLNLDTDLILEKPELRVTVDRDKAADIGADVATIGRTLETMLGGRQVTRFKREGRQYEVIVQVEDRDRQTPDDLSEIYVRGDEGEIVQLSNLVRVEESIAPRELNHFKQLRSATISASLAPGYTVGEALAYLDETAARVLPATAQIDYAGQSREFRTSSADLYFTFLLALIFIYLVLAAQFESFRDPFIIMLTVPLSMTGALAALKLSGGTLNVYSQIGLVTLVGLITKHGILLVEFSNQLRERGLDTRAAVIQAASLRLRPILMTTGAMVLGALPLAMAHGAGAESRQQIGWVIVGGLLLGTLLTLFVIPAAYTYLAGRHTGLEEAEEPSGTAPATAPGD
ncbi:MAG TPA: efflux RND transporter permease subunit [Alphaproteobacteria bacterium]|nr:efflux RND transporter permease subunit [Alphaproteobacteria bacterium]